MFDTQVEFLEAIQAYSEGKDIFVVIDDQIKVYNNPKNNDLAILSDDSEEHFGEALSPNDILKGIWYVKA